MRSELCRNIAHPAANELKVRLIDDQHTWSDAPWRLGLERGVWLQLSRLQKAPRNPKRLCEMADGAFPH
jgi:hypothetical protein